jgi:hypothetical protein
VDEVEQPFQDPIAGHAQTVVLELIRDPGS